MKVSSTSIVGLSKDLTHEIVNLKQIHIIAFTRTNNANKMLGKLTLDVQRYKFMSPGRHRGVTIIGRAIVNPRMMPSCLCKSYSASCHFLISICKMPCLQTNETFYLNLKTPSTLRSIHNYSLKIIRVLFLAQANLIKEFFVYRKFVRSKSIYPK